jgi:hypothetical protein
MRKAEKMGCYWSFENPMNDRSGYAWRYGVPPYNPSTGEGNMGTRVTVAVWGGMGAILGPAAPAPGYPG